MSDHLPDEVVVKVEEEEAKERSVHIPNGVVVEILLRLPPKTLVRCRCVCKDWYSLISSNTFIASHTKRALSQSCDNNESNLVLLRYKRILDLGAGRSHIFFSLVSDDASFVFTEDLSRLDFPSNSARYFPERLLCSFNGLLCFAEYQLLKLWNPSIHKVLSLPKPNITSLTHGSYVDFHGLGYDLSSNDLKLVRLVYPERHPDKVPPLVEIFTLIASCWREITAPGPSYMIKQHCFSVFLNGASHWIAHTSPHEHTFRNVIVSFDMVGEVFREIAVPSSFVRKSPLEMTLAVRDGLLCLVPRYPLSEQQFSSVWIMKEYGIRESWTKLFDIHLNEGLARVVGFRKNGEVLVTDGEGELLSYEPNTQQVTHLGFHEQRSHRLRPQCTFFFDGSCYFWEKYMETILLLNMKKLVSKASTNMKKRRQLKCKKVWKGRHDTLSEDAIGFRKVYAALLLRLLGPLAWDLGSDCKYGERFKEALNVLKYHQVIQNSLLRQNPKLLNCDAEKDMSDCLPDEVLFEILLRVPEWEISTCKLVCKSWCSLISSLHFIVAYLDLSLSNPRKPPYSLLNNMNSKNKEVTENNPTLRTSNIPCDCMNYRKLRSTPRKLDKLKILAGSPTGKFCLTSDPDRRLYVLWNPSVHEAIALPQPDVGIRAHLWSIVAVGARLWSVGSLGIGYVPKSDDYTLVWMYSERSIYRSLDEIHHRGSMESPRHGFWFNLNVSHHFSQMAKSKCVHID